MILKNFLRITTSIKSKDGDMIFAYGRDPFFSGWPDTVQLDYSNPATVEAMLGETSSNLRTMRWCKMRYGNAYSS